MCWSETGDFKVLNKFACRKSDENIREAVEQEE